MATTNPWASLIDKPFAWQSPGVDPKETARTENWGWPDTLRNISQLGTFGFEKGSRAIGRSEQALDPLLGFYRTILGGDRQAIMQLMAPEVSTIVSQYDTARRTAAEFAPRGGGRTQALSELPFRQAGDINRLFQETRKGALGGLERVGGAYGELGVRELGLSAGAYQSLIEDVLQKYAIDKKAKTEMGTGLGKLLAMLIAGGKRGGG